MLVKIYAKAVLFDSQGRVLLLRRSLTDDQKPGEQDFPGGEVEPGEDVGAGMAREIMEETGMTISVSDLHLRDKAVVGWLSIDTRLDAV